VNKIVSNHAAPAGRHSGRVASESRRRRAGGAGLAELLRHDEETLREVCAGLAELEREWSDARLSVTARQRGYFTPDEDDRVRQMILAYRNYRFALYEIIYHHYSYRQVTDREQQLRSFVLGFAAALTLYAKSLKLIQAYERETLVRRKLNEPDAKFELAAGLFDELLQAYSSLGNYWELLRALWFWQANRRAIQKLVHIDAGWKDVIDTIVHQRAVVRQRFVGVVLRRLRYDWRALWKTTFQPVRRTRYSIQSLIGGACAELRTGGPFHPAIDAAVIAQLRPLLRPGDVLLMRAEKKLTAAVLPGFWAHAALFVGGTADIEELGLTQHAHVARRWTNLIEKNTGNGCVVEAITPRVRIESLERALLADNVVVLRPGVEAQGLRQAIIEAFGHVDKPYDFEFNFNVSTRIVCTELIYRCYHRRGPIEFSLIKRLGRYTLSGDDIMNMVVGSFDRPGSPVPFEPVALALKMAGGRAQIVSRPEIVPALRRLQAGWRPANETEAQGA